MKIAKQLITALLTIFLWINSTIVVYAELLYKESISTQLAQNQTLIFSKKIEKSVDFIDFNQQVYLHEFSKKLLEKKLIKASIHLRDIARYLGTDFPLTVVILDRKTEKIKGRITEFKNNKGNWVSTTVGHVLNMVSQEIQILEESDNQKLVNFLIKNESINQPIINMPLDYYCQQLLNYVEIRYGKKYNLL
jgi:Na+/phosphate symporter